MKKFVLFPATDLTAGELFRAELSECKSKEKLGETITGFDCTKYPGAPSSFVTVHSALTKPTGCLSLLSPSKLFSQTASVCSPSELFSFVHSTWPEEDPVDRPCR